MYILVLYEVHFIFYILFSFFFNDTATTEIYTLSLHDALPISKKLFEKYEFSKFLFNKINKEEIKSVKLLSPLTFPSKKIEVSDFINLFRDRYKSIKEILEKENLINLSSIRKIGNKNSFWTIIAMVSDKRVTKNKNLLVEIEDLTGKSVVLINKENKELFNSAKNRSEERRVGKECRSRWSPYH